MLTRFRTACLYGVLQKVAQYHGDVGLGNAELCGNLRFHDVIDPVVFRLLRKIEQHRIGSRVGAKAN